MRRRIIHVKVGDMVLLETHFLSSKAHKNVAKFGPKFVSPYKVIKVIKNNLVLDIDGRLTTVYMDQVRVYKTRLSASSSSRSSNSSLYRARPVLRSLFHLLRFIYHLATDPECEPVIPR